MINYYTDGSTAPTNPGPGGYAVVTREGEPIALGSEDGATTNIRMEGLAILSAMRAAKGQPVSIHSDSLFWINVLTKWAPGWQAKNWKKASGPIANLDLVKEMFGEYCANEDTVTLIWVKGHNGDPGNEFADQWANKAREGERLSVK